MKENHIYQDIIFDLSGATVKEHLETCPSCNTLKEKVDEVMSLLDTEFEISEHIAASILSKKKSITPRKTFHFTVSSYLQISLIVISGIFLGFVLGKNANTSILQSDKSKYHKSLIELREMYHLNIEEPTYLL